MAEKRYSGYGYHGGGRPKKKEGTGAKTLSISGAPEQIAAIKKAASEANVTTSNYVLNKVLKD